MTTVTSPPARRAERLRGSARGWVATVRERPLAFSVATLGVLMLVGAVNLYRKGLGLTFNYDEWNWVMNRRGWPRWRWLVWPSWNCLFLLTPRWTLSTSRRLCRPRSKSCLRSTLGITASSTCAIPTRR